MAVSMRISLLALLTVLAVPAPVPAQRLQARDWAGACTVCHSTGYDSAVDAGDERRASVAIPAIAGMDKSKFIGLMTAFRKGSRESTVMHQLAVGLSKEQIDALGDYFAGQRPQ